MVKSKSRLTDYRITEVLLSSKRTAYHRIIETFLSEHLVRSTRVTEAIIPFSNTNLKIAPLKKNNKGKEIKIGFTSVARDACMSHLQRQ